MKKRVLSLLLALLLAFSSLHVPVLAIDDVLPEEAELFEALPENGEEVFPDEEDLISGESANTPAADEDLDPADDLAEIGSDTDELYAGEEVTSSEDSGEELEKPTDTDEPDEAPAALVLVRFVSTQEFTLTVTCEDSVVAPATEENTVAARPEDESAEEFAFSTTYLLIPGSYSYTAVFISKKTVEGEESAEPETITGKLDVTENMAWGTVVKLAPNEELPYGLKGMPEGYELSEVELAKKQALTDRGVAEITAMLVPDVDYREGEVFFLTDSEEYAQMVAEAYSAELKSFSCGVAVLTLTTATVLEAVTAAADMNVPLPAVEANQIIPLPPEYSEPLLHYAWNQTMSGEEVNVRESWESWLANSTEPDSYLLDPTGESYQYMHDMVNTYEAWGVTKGGGVRVAVIDYEGVDISHEELATDPHSGWHPTGTNGDQGTHEAGIIAARENNGAGGAGIAPEAVIVPYRVANYDIGYHVAAVRHAAKFGKADVIDLNLSGLAYSTQLETVLNEVINEYGATVVVPIGSNSTNLKLYPAAYSIPGLITVGSVDRSGSRSWFSNYGSWQDVAAPGSAIMSTVPGGYDFMSGTSMAAAVTSGVCALYLSVNSDATPAQVEKAVKAATTNGIVDASKLFAKQTQAPEITLYGLTGTKVAYGSRIRIYSAVNPDVDDIVYTLNGKTPVVKNGIITEGMLYTGEIEVIAELGFTAGRKVTLKAVRVNGLGVVGKVASKTFTVSYADPKEVTIINVPPYVAAGKSVTLKACVDPEQAEQKVTWSFLEGEPVPSGAAINPKTGVLTTTAATTGTVWIRAASVNDDEISDVVSINVVSVKPVKTIMLDSSSLAVALYDSDAEPVPLHAAAFDADGDVVENVLFTYESSNTKVVTVDSQGFVTGVGKGKATITVKAQDGSNVKAVCKVTVRQMVTSIEIQGLGYVAPGKTSTYKAKVFPSNADNKAYSWSVSDNEAGITINSKGKLTIPGTVPVGTSITISAAPKDGGIAVFEKTVHIQPVAAEVGISLAADEPFYNSYTSNANGTLQQADLYTLEASYYMENEKLQHNMDVQLTTTVDVPVNLGWSSSNTKVALVDQTGKVTAGGAGTATITCRVADAGGKKATAKIRVITPSSGVSVISSLKTYTDNIVMIAAGKSAKNTAKLGDAFGKPSVTKVNWYVEPYVYDAEGQQSEQTAMIEDEILAKKLVTISKSGVFNTKSALNSYLSQGYLIIAAVIAETTDGMNLYDEVTYLIQKPVTKVTVNGKTSVKTACYAGTDGGAFLVQAWFGNSEDDWFAGSDFDVKSSNPNIAGGVLFYDEDDNAYVEVIAGMKKGTAKITVSATDGTGKKAVIIVKVY